MDSVSIHSLAVKKIQTFGFGLFVRQSLDFRHELIINCFKNAMK